MKKVVAIALILFSFQAFAGVGDGNETKGDLKKTESKEIKADFPNPIIKLIKFFIRDFNSDYKTIHNKVKRDTTNKTNYRYSSKFGF